MSQTRREIRELITRHGLAPRKRLGQHFLADQNLVNKVVGLAGDPSGTRVLEVGAGTGTLTRSLAEAGFDVVAYEVDTGLRPLLEEVLADVEVDLRFEDATTVDPARFTADQRWVLVANLPYNVGTPILLDLIRYAPGVQRAVVMVQREVADRLTAHPGSRDYGLPSVIARMYGIPRFEFSVPSQVFVPPPKVESAVVSVERVAAPDPERERAIVLASAAFSQRRKMLRSSLKVLVDDVEERLSGTTVASSSRAEELSPEQYLEIARAVPA